MYVCFHISINHHTPQSLLWEPLMDESGIGSEYLLWPVIKIQFEARQWRLAAELPGRSFMSNVSAFWSNERFAFCHRALKPWSAFGSCDLTRQCWPSFQRQSIQREISRAFQSSAWYSIDLNDTAQTSHRWTDSCRQSEIIAWDDPVGLAEKLHRWQL